MNPLNQTLSPFALDQIPTLLRGEPGPIQSWMARWSAARLILYGAVIVVGTAAFGGAVGMWRDVTQACYTAVKSPLILLLTALGNGLLNGMLAPLLGVNITFRQSLLAIFMSFTIGAAVLGACSPLMYFVVWNTPPLDTQAAGAATTHSMMFVALVVFMAIAGIAGNVRLWQWLRELSGSRTSAGRTLAAWLAGNLLLGSQLTWVLRPFVGSPSLPVEFLRPNAFEGNLFEALFHHLQNLFS